MSKNSVYPATPLARFITERLHQLGLKQVDFCRQTGFDQGLLSKLQSAVITTINLESALRLADGSDEVHEAALAKSMLYGVAPHDLWTVTGAAAVLGLTALISGYVPAARAARVDPLTALRNE